MSGLDRRTPRLRRCGGPEARGIPKGAGGTAWGADPHRPALEFRSLQWSFKEQFRFHLEFYATAHRNASPTYGKHWVNWQHSEKLR